MTENSRQGGDGVNIALINGYSLSWQSHYIGSARVLPEGVSCEAGFEAVSM